MEAFFPDTVDSAKTKEYYSLLKRRTVLVLERIDGKDTTAQIERIDLELLRLLPPKRYDGHDGEEIQTIKAYERACAVMRQHQTKDPKVMTVLEFYETLEAMKASGKKQKVNGESY